MRTNLLAFLACGLLGGCIASSESTSRGALEEGEEGEQDDNDDCKIEGDQIGEEGVVLRLSGHDVTFHDWVNKTGETGEYVGFSITVSNNASLGYVVKTGGDSYASSDGTWMHPAGPDGEDAANAISNVDFCDSDEGGTDDGGDDRTDDGGTDDGGDGGDGDPIIL